MDELDALIAKNVNAGILKLKHGDLERNGQPGTVKSRCPACKEGTLPMRRHPTLGFLEATDRCLLCGQEVVYTDIQEIRNGNVKLKEE